jgi:hypothetical protein
MGFPKHPTGKRPPLYPKGSPSNLKATLYLNKKRRDKFFLPNEQGAEWAIDIWYHLGDTVVYDGTDYRCVMNHRSQVGWEPDVVDSTRWVEVV